MARVWGELDILVEREADQTRTSAMGLYMAAGAVMGGKDGAKLFNKWLDGLG